MTRFSSIKNIFFCLVFCLLFFSCKKGPGSHPSWNTSILAPLLTTSLGLDDILADSLLQTNSDHSLSLVFSNELYHFSLTDQAIKIPDTSIIASFSLQNLGLANQTIVYPLTLGQICLQLGVVGIIIISQNGDSFPIPPFNDITTGDNDIDATQFFESADLESGFIDLTLENGLPIEISNVVFQMKNKVGQEIITEESFQNILPGQTQTKVIDLSGKTVEGTLTAKILDFDSPGGTAVIDTSDAIIMTMKAHDLVVNEATAVFPSQNLIDEDKETVYTLSGGAQLNELKIKSGKLTIALQSTIQQKSHFEFALPSAKDENGNSISLDEDLPPAPSGGTSNVTETFDLSGYTLDLTGISGTSYNTYYSHLVASIDSTGELVTISKDDSVFIDYTLEDIVPEYVSGYLGQQILTVGPDQTMFDALKNIKDGSVSLEDAAIDMTIKNSVGASGRINLHELVSINSTSGNEVPLTWNLLNKPLEIQPATDNPLAPSVSTFSLNSSNSNIKSLVENLPDALQYSLDIFINPFGNTSNYHDFAYDSSEVEADLDVTVPLSLIAQDLVLQDTVDFSLNTEEEGDPTVKDGTFNLIAVNGFPISASSQVYFYDENYEFIDSLFTSANVIAAGKINDECMVSEAVKTILNIPVDETKMSRLKKSSKAVIRAAFNTASSPACSSWLKIYDDYIMDIKLTGNFTFYTGY